MRHFAIRLIIFFLPIVLPTIGNLVAAYYVGETMLYEEVIARQQNDRQLVIYEPAWRRIDMIQYKFVATLNSDPNLLFLGSSRMLDFRSQLMTEDSAAFYNASFYSASTFEMYRFLQALVENDVRPDVVIVGFDLPRFNGDISTFSQDRDYSVLMPDSSDYSSRRLTAFYRTAQLWFEDDGIFNYVLEARSDEQIFLGLQTLETHSGFIYDGSRYFSVRQLEVKQARINQQYINLNNRNDLFRTGQSLNNEALRAVEDLLQFAQESDIILIGILPPFHPDFYAELHESDDFSYFNAASTALAEIFAKYSFPFHDYSDSSVIGGTNADFRDGIHFSEGLAAQIYLDLVRQHPDILDVYTNIERLENVIEEADDPFYVFYDRPEQ
jgi:Protein of unknown function (DUF1574)